MSKILLRATSGGSVGLKTQDVTTDLEYTLFSNDIESRVLSGAELTAVGIVGANPVATLWANGDITGSSDNGSFTKSANGNLECVRNSLASSGAGDVRWTFPIVFNSPPFTVGVPRGTGTSALSMQYKPALVGYVDFSLYNSNSVAQTAGAQHIAKGRFK